MRRWFLVLGSKRLETTEAWISFYLLLALVTSVVWLWWQLFCGQLKAWLNPISVERTEIEMKKTISALRLLILTGTFVTWLPAHIKFKILHIILETFEIITYTVNIYMYKTIQARVNTVAIPTTGKSCRLYWELLPPILGIPLASIGKLPFIGKLPIVA